MNETLFLAFAAGLASGAFFFAGLYWTVSRGLSSKRPALLFLTSLLLRVSLVSLAFYWTADGDFKRLILCLLGFMLSRPLINRFVSKQGSSLCS